MEAAGHRRLWNYAVSVISNAIFVREQKCWKHKKRLKFQHAHIVRQTERLPKRRSEGARLQEKRLRGPPQRREQNLPRGASSKSSIRPRSPAAAVFDTCSTNVSNGFHRPYPPEEDRKATVAPGNGPAEKGAASAAPESSSQQRSRAYSRTSPLSSSKSSASSASSAPVERR